MGICQELEKKLRSTPRGSASAQEPEHQRDQSAEQDRSREGEVEGVSLTAYGEIAGKPANGEMEPACRYKDRTRGYQHKPNNDQKLSQIAHTVILGAGGEGAYWIIICNSRHSFVSDCRSARLMERNSRL